MAQQLSAEGGAQLQQGIAMILSRWFALQLAVDNDFAGNMPNLLAAEIFSFFTQTNEPLYIDDLEDRLDDFMLTLNTEVDDGSIEEIAERLMIMHEECLLGNYQSVQMLRDNPLPQGGNRIIQEGNDDDDDDDDDGKSIEEDESSGMAVDASKSRSNVMNGNDKMMVDEPSSSVEAETDGWTVVSRRGNKGRKN